MANGKVEAKDGAVAPAKRRASSLVSVIKPTCCPVGLTQINAQSPMVDASKLAAIGYCFGGMPALDLARSGAPLVDVVTFHGSLGTPNPESNKNIKGHVLVLHGAADPIVNAEAVAKFEQEMTAAGVDWQVVLYGNGVMHAFTDHVHIQAPDHGIKYDAEADKRSWQAMTDLLKSTL